MKKRELSKLVFLGMVSGLATIANQSSVEGFEEQSEAQHFLAAHSCKNKGGCGSLTADRSPNDSSNASEFDNDNDNESDEDEDLQKGNKNERPSSSSSSSSSQKQSKKSI